MLIFQINQDKLDKELKSIDWLFWNNYLSSRTQEDDYVLLPAYIDYIQDTNQPQAGESFLVELEQNEDGDEVS